LHQVLPLKVNSISTTSVLALDISAIPVSNINRNGIGYPPNAVEIAGALLRIPGTMRIVRKKIRDSQEMITC
jgi:hypothetical protein